MILAIAALLLHVPAVPQSSLPDDSSIAGMTESVSRQPDDQSTAVDSRPVTVATLQPGRLTPTPVAPAGIDPALDAPAPSPSFPAAAAFIAPSPAAVHAREEERRRKRIWLGLSIADHSAATFDAWTTRRVISSGEGYEMDPLMRPFAGNASLYAAMQAGPLLFEYVGWRMMKSRHGWERRTWWVPQSLGMAMNLASGAHNLGVH